MKHAHEHRLPPLRAVSLSLLLAVAAFVAPAARAAASPNCADTSAPVQRLICSDTQLTQQDQALGELYGQALQQLTDTERKRVKARQEKWLTAREACVNGERPRECIADQQKRRIIELRIGLGQLTSRSAVEYVCPGQSAPVFASYYPTDPPAAVLTFGGRQAVTFIAESASGARYLAGDVEIWEHQGKATIKWGKTQVVCSRP